MLKEYKSITPSSRNLIRIKLNNKQPSLLLKLKTKYIKKNAGRNNSGKITVHHQGGGVKKRYRDVNFLRNYNSIGIVMNIEYDPYRTAHIAAVYDFLNKQFYYILQPKNLKVGNIIKSGSNAELKLGHSLPIRKIPEGSFIHNVSTNPNKKGQFCRSAGNFSQIIEKTTKYGRIKLPSKEQRYIPINCFATLGIVSNELKILTTLGKAGRNRWLNKRPTVRGVAMNPIDHPHGGGEGKTSGGRTAVTPWGKPAKNKKTSRSLNKLIIKKS